MKANEGILLYGESIRNADLYYATRFLSIDPIIYIKTGKKELLVVEDFEKPRAKDISSVKKVIGMSSLKGGMLDSLEGKICNALENQGIKKVIVPYNFSFGLAGALKRNGFNVAYDEGLLKHERSIKTKEEIAAITQVQRATEHAVKEAMKIIKKSKINNGLLYYHGSLLTSEYIKKVISMKLIEKNCVCEGMIVSSGDDACNAHCEGSGPLEAYKPIVMDIFPRSLSTFYYADMTRTVARGQPSKEIMDMYNDVKQAQKAALKEIKAGADFDEIYSNTVDFFSGKGYKSGKIKGKLQGFFHGLGHGLGLEVHEGYNSPLEENEVITVEPGLYYFGVGGVRIEDMVVVTNDGFTNLTSMPKNFVL